MVLKPVKYYNKLFIHKKHSEFYAALHKIVFSDASLDDLTFPQQQALIEYCDMAAKNTVYKNPRITFKYIRR